MTVYCSVAGLGGGVVGLIRGYGEEAYIGSTAYIGLTANILHNVLSAAQSLLMYYLVIHA